MMSGFKTISGKIERDNDWQEGMNAFRGWTTAEIDVIVKRLHDMEVFFEKFKEIHDYFETWQKRQLKEQQKINGEVL
jgi:hypothetical protein